MNTEENSKISGRSRHVEENQPRCHEEYARITARVKQSVALMDHAVAAAKVDALRLFQELDRHMKRAREMAEQFPPEDSQAEWCRNVSAIMDALERPGELMDSLAALGMVVGRRPPGPSLEWLFGDEPKTI